MRSGSTCIVEAWGGVHSRVFWWLQNWYDAAYLWHTVLGTFSARVDFFGGKAVRLCFLGESFVNGTGDPEMLGWVGRVCAVARQAVRDLTMYNLGIRRETSDQLLLRWEAEVERRLPSDADPRLVFSFGVNDTTEEHGGIRVPIERSLANAQAILTVATRRCPTLFVGPPPVADDAAQNARIGRLSLAYAEVCAGLGVPYLETYAPLLRSQVWQTEARAGDGAHPAAAGYAAMAALVQAWPAWLAWLR